MMTLQTQRLSAAELVQFNWAYKIPLRDGVCLNATLYTPTNLVTPQPCVFLMTPYISDNYHDRGVYFASHGMPFAIVDVRGRGNSDGVFRPRIQEARDAHDVVEWLAQQPFCNGKVAMWGGSYSGYAQWVAAKEFPPHLTTIVPVAAPRYGVEVPMRNNIFSPYMVQWLTFVGGRTSQKGIYSDASFWSAIFRRWHQSGRPFREVDVMAGHPSAIFQEYLDHPQPDAYWDAYNPSAEQYGHIDMPILTITGNYDDDQPGALAHYQLHMQYGSPEARSKHYLIIGPWDHAGTRTPERLCGGLEFGDAALLDLGELHLQWYAWTMGAGARPAFLRKRVAYYVMGAEEWRYADTLEDVTDGYQTLFLSSMGCATDVFSAGALTFRPGGSPDSYTYDPREVDGPEVEAEARTSGASYVDQSVTLALQGRQLVYHTLPFEEDTDITGFFKFSAWISIDCPDTDLYASVHEITSSGASIRLSTDGIRARYRESLRVQKLIDTRDPLLYEFERFTFTSRRIKRGHRLRLILAPIGRLVDFTFAQKNFNAGGIVSEESSEEGRPVTVTLYHDDVRPSALRIPIDKNGRKPTRPIGLMS